MIFQIILVSDINEEKELLKAMLMSLEVPMENSESISFLIDVGFTANQVILAVTKANTFELEHLVDRLTNGAKGNLRISI